MKDVKIKDRKYDVEILRMACNLAELNIGYVQADLILKLQDRLEKIKGKFSLHDGIEIHHKWKEDWIKYFEELDNEKNR